MNYFVKGAITSGSNQQIHFACFRHKPSRISLSRSHSYFDGMPDRSLPGDRCLERVIAGGFAVENQLNLLTSRSGIHRHRLHAALRSAPSLPIP